MFLRGLAGARLESSNDQPYRSQTPDVISRLGNIRVIRCLGSIREAHPDRAHHTPEASEVMAANRVLVGE